MYDESTSTVFIVVWEETLKENLYIICVRELHELKPTRC